MSAELNCRHCSR